MSMYDVSSQSTSGATLAKLAVVALVYGWLGHVTHGSILRDGFVSLVWIGGGLALAALLLGGPRYLWALALGELGERLLLQGHSTDQLIVAGLANVLEMALGYWLLKKWPEADGSLVSLQSRGFLRLILLGGGLASFVASLFSATGLLALGAIQPDWFGGFLFSRWMGHVLGITLLAPLLLAWFSNRHDLVGLWRRHGWEGLALLGLTFFMGQIVFLEWFHDLYVGQIARGYWLFLPVVWIAVRLGRRGVTVALVMIALQALWGAKLEKGFFADDLEKTALMNYWYFMMILSGVGISVASYVSSLAQATRDLVVKDSALNATDNSVVITDRKGRIEWANPAFFRLTGYNLAEAVGRSPGELVKSGQHGAEFYRQMWHTLRVDKRAWRGDIVNRRKDGSLYEEEMTISPVFDEEGDIDHFVAVKQDVSRRKALEREVQELAFHDALTHLPNRRLLGDRLAQAIAGCRRDSGYAALMALDMDRFKLLNDMHGHALGDQMLIEVATRLKKCVREVDTVARMGGDEFVVLLENLGADPGKARAQAVVVAEKIRAGLAQPYVLQTTTGSGPVTHDSSASIGVIVFGESSVTAEDVLKWADVAMYEAKRAGRNGVHFFASTAGASLEQGS